MKRFPLTISIILLLCFGASAQSKVELGTAQDGTYTNPGFNFSFKYPKDWTVHGEATNERIKEIGKEKLTENGAISKPNVEVSLKNTYYLLTVFRYPLGKPGITFNPAVMIVAERITHAPGITDGKDYLLNVRPVLQKTGYQVLLKEPVEYHFGGSQFFRDSYSAEVNGVHVNQTFFARIVNGFALAFIFIGENEQSVDEMAKAMETYAPGGKGTITTIIGNTDPPKKPKP